MESSNSIKSYGDGINFTIPANTGIDMALVCPISSCKYDIDSQYNSNIPNITTNCRRYNHLITPVVPMQLCGQKAICSSKSPSSSAATSYCNTEDYQRVNINIFTVNNSNTKQKTMIKTNTPLTQGTNFLSTDKLYNTGITPIIRIDGKSKSLKQKWKGQKNLNPPTHLLITPSNNSLNYTTSVSTKTNISTIYEIIDVSDSESDEKLSYKYRKHTKDKHIRKRKIKKEMINHLPTINTTM